MVEAQAKEPARCGRQEEDQAGCPSIDEIAAEKIEQDEPIKQRDVRDEIAPLLAEMPGFDWRPLFRAVVEYRQQEAARLEAVAQIERIRAIERDDDDVLALLMSF